MAQRIPKSASIVLLVLSALIAVHFMLSNYLLRVVHEMSIANGDSTFVFPNAPEGSFAGFLAGGLKFPLHDAIFFQFTGRVNHFINAVAFWLLLYSLLVAYKRLRGAEKNQGYWSVKTWLITVSVSSLAVGAALLS